jgi:signal transduction histidine kinase
VELTQAWNTFRRFAAMATVVAGLGMGLAWGWAGGYIAVAMALLALAESTYRLHRPHSGSAVLSVVLDVTLVGGAMVIVQLEPAGIGALFVYMAAAPLLLLPPRAAGIIIAYGAVWTSIALTGFGVIPLPSSVQPAVVSLVAYMIFTAHLLALIVVVARSIERSQRLKDLRLSKERALAKCGQELLAGTDTAAIDRALAVVVDAAQAEVAFVGENRLDRTGRSCTRVTHTTGGHNDSMIAYHNQQILRRKLLAGRPSQLALPDDGTEAIAIPIFVNGTWTGLLGLVPGGHRAVEGAPDLGFLTTVATMIGAFWERRSAYERLERLIRSKDQFLASISHEIRTPMTSVLGFASILQDELTLMNTAEVAEIVDLVENQAQEVADIVDDLLVAARAEIDAVAVVAQPIDIQNEIRAVLAGRLLSEGRQVRVAGELCPAVGDPARVRQILRNLLTNAVRYGGNRIDIGVRCEGGSEAVIVSDDGPGIPPELRRKVFDAYCTASQDNGQPHSIGLGLTVARHLARLMGGDLTLRQDLGPAAFELTLPAAHAESQREPEPGAIGQGSAALPGPP